MLLICYERKTLSAKLILNLNVICIYYLNIICIDIYNMNITYEYDLYK